MININGIHRKTRTPTEIRQRHFELGQMWPDNTWTTNVKSERLHHDTICDCCHELATRIAITNVWGSVCEVYCCVKHYADVHNTWRDCIPNEKEKKEVANEPDRRYSHLSNCKN